jgi:hypothetical protein
MPENYSGRLKPKLFTQERRRIVPKLVRMPVILLVPCLEFDPFIFGQAFASILFCFTIPQAQMLCRHSTTSFFLTSPNFY